MGMVSHTLGIGVNDYQHIVTMDCNSNYDRMRITWKQHWRMQLN